jgi:hypothetical protein
LRFSAAPICALPFLAALACGGSGNPMGPETPPPVFSTHSSNHFTFRYTPLDTGTIGETAAAVEGHYARITNDLGVAAQPRVTVTLHADRSSLQDAVRPFVGTLPSFASGLVTGPDSIHILSPNLSGTWSYASGVTAIVHEFAHCVSLTLNPGFGNRPRWLWESVALYEAGQRTDVRSIPLVVANRPPTIAELNALDNPLIYDLGHSLGDFIVSRFGRSSLVDLIRVNGDTRSVVGLAEDDFLAAWLAFVRQ